VKVDPAPTMPTIFVRIVWVIALDSDPSCRMRDWHRVLFWYNDNLPAINAGY